MINVQISKFLGMRMGVTFGAKKGKSRMIIFKKLSILHVTKKEK